VVSHVKTEITKIKRDTLDGRDRFIRCLHGICNVNSGYPPFATTLVQRVLYELPKLAGEIKTQALEILMWRATEIPDLFRELKIKDLTSLIRRFAPQTQSVVLSILTALCPTLSATDIAWCMPMVTEVCHNHTDLQVRSLYFQFLMTIYDIKLR